MIFDTLRKMFDRPAKRSSTAQKAQSNAAENEFTSEGAPLPGKSGTASEHPVKAAEADRD